MPTWYSDGLPAVEWRTSGDDSQSAESEQPPSGNESEDDAKDGKAKNGKKKGKKQPFGGKKAAPFGSKEGDQAKATASS